jgi:hypothetical protein
MKSLFLRKGSWRNSRYGYLESNARHDYPELRQNSVSSRVEVLLVDEGKVVVQHVQRGRDEVQQSCSP